MSEEIKQSKLDSKLDDSKSRQTGRQTKKLKFTDYAIERYMADFICKKTGKIKKEVKIAFDVGKGTALKGLKLIQYYKTKSKYFLLQFWLDGKSDYVRLGQFRQGVFGAKECQNKVYELVETHTNDEGFWFKHPRLTLHDKKTKITKAEIEKSQQLTIRRVIERIAMDGFPKAKRQGSLSVNSIKQFIKFMFGFNWRSRCLVYAENDKGYGTVSFQHRTTPRKIVKPTSWEDLFNKFPGGTGVITNKKLNPLLETSLYDNDLSKLVIDELNEGMIKKYIDKSSRSYGTKANMLDCFRRLWSFSLDNNLFGDVPPNINFDNITFKKPDTSKSRTKQYDNLRFSDNQLPIIFNALMKRRDKYPFQAEALLFLMFTGRRTEETLKIKWSDVDLENRVITLRRGITKARKEEFVDITDPLSLVLASLKKHREGKYDKYRFIDWLFPTLRTNTQRLYDNQYVRSHSTRMKTLRGCWEDLVQETGIMGSPKMFRKTFSSIAKLTLGTTSKARALTGHEQDATLDVHYDKTSRETAKEYATEVAKKFDFVKKTG